MQTVHLSIKPTVQPSSECKAITHVVDVVEFRLRHHRKQQQPGIMSAFCAHGSPWGGGKWLAGKPVAKQAEPPIPHTL
jgi:hypothetical protein